ncbi:hypothetical protein [Taibaiella koreensis]|uniref:hypothetical protein n=1 Tax=Taibaiella koreensis TaxID=1268548 RepID=UPI0013C2AF7C|nr:hypothetical protein [Taibaiella koreensis]
MEQFYHRRVVVLPDKALPSSFIDYTKGKRYNANRILEWLADAWSDTTLCAVGLTDEDIFTTKRDARGQVRQPVNKGTNIQVYTK